MNQKTKKQKRGYKIKTQTIFLLILVGFIIPVYSISQTVFGGTIRPESYYTWGISNDDITIPDGSIITEAVLTIHNITSAGENQNDSVYIHLLDDPPLGFVANDDYGTGNFFQDIGLALPLYKDQTAGIEDFTYIFSQLNDPTSYYWQIFDYPLVFGTSTSVVIDSSFLLELINYAGNSTPLGFGLDPDGLESFNFDNITLDLTIQSFQGPAQQFTLTFTTALLKAIGDKTVDEIQMLTFTINEPEPDGDPITYSVQNLPTGATFLNRVFTWTPAESQVGLHQVTFTADNGTLNDSETITITVNNVNKAPVLASIGDKSTNENVTLTFGISATDPDGDAIIYSAQNLPTGATFANGTFTWKPTYDQAGTYPVTFIASDGQLTDSETVTITVNDVNRQPVLAAIGDKSTNENVTLTFGISATDPDGDAIIYSAQNLPTGATFANGTFTWKPTYDQAGTYPVTFIVSDGQLTDSETVTITVNDINRQPALAVIGNKSTNENVTLTFGISATDPDGDPLTYSAQNLPTGAVLIENTFTWRPWYSQQGSHDITFAVSDGQSQDSETITITVNNMNLASWYQTWLTHLGLL